MSISGGEILLEVFKSQGIEYIFCSPGSEHFPIWESLARRYTEGDRTLKYINCRHEVLAVSMALAYAQTTGRLPAVLLHAGVGPLNAAMAIRIAHRASVPMIICCGDTADYGEGEDDRGDCWKWVGALAETGGTDALVKTYVKWSNEVKSKEILAGYVYQACAIAQSFPKGPVLLTIPWEFLLRTQPEVIIRPPSHKAVLPDPRPQDLEEVANLLMTSKQPIILTEHAGMQPEAVPKLVELAELLGIPVFESIYPRFANFPREHPLHMGYDASRALPEADAIFIVGGITPWQPASAFPKKGAKAVLLDGDTVKERLPYWGYQVDLSVTADVSQWLSALLDIIRTRVSQSARPGSPYRKRTEQWQAKHDQLTESWKTEALSRKDSQPISPRWFLYKANEILPAHSYILTETATHSTLVQRYMAKPNGFFKVIAGGLGMGLGEAVGMKLALQDRPVVFIVGDGSFIYNPVLAGLGLCQEYHLPILIIVLNNGIYASMRSIHEKYYPKGWSARSNMYFGVDLAPVTDYTKLAEAFGAYGERLKDPSDIEPALNRALQQMAKGKSALLDVILDPLDTGGYASIGTQRE